MPTIFLAFHFYRITAHLSRTLIEGVSGEARARWVLLIIRLKEVDHCFHIFKHDHQKHRNETLSPVGAQFQFVSINGKEHICRRGFLDHYDSGFRQSFPSLSPILHSVFHCMKNRPTYKVSEE